MIDYSNYSDEELVKEYKSTNDEAILDSLMYRFHGLISSSAAPLYLTGADREDLIQEGRLGLYNAIESFDESKNHAFVPFAKLCIRRAQLKAIESYNRKKHSPLNTSVSFSSDDEEINIPMETNVSSPEDIMIEIFDTEEMLKEIEKSLSSMEMDVLLYLVEGYNYHQIAGFLGKEAKSVDNAIQRLRSKIQRIVRKKNNE